MDVTLSDLAAVAGVLQRSDVSPVVAAGRMLGLTPEEQRSVPGWAIWGSVCLMCAGAGVLLARHLARRSER
jgi:hypothetical protein